MACLFPLRVLFGFLGGKFGWFNLRLFCLALVWGDYGFLICDFVIWDSLRVIMFRRFELYFMLLLLWCVIFYGLIGFAGVVKFVTW